MKCPISIIIVLSIVIPCSIQAQWAPANGPYGGSVTALAVGNNIIFSGSSGVRYSTNNGANWIAAGLDGLTINYLFLAGNTLYAATTYSGVCISTNNGQSWVQTPLGGITDAVIANSSTILSGYYGQGVYRSSNNGASWTQTALSSGTVTAFARSGVNIFAATGSDVYRSIDDGLTWTPAGINQQMGSFAVSGTNIYAGSGHGVYMSTNSGTSWSQIGLTNVQFVFSLAVSGNTVLAGTLYGGLYITTNNGANWTQTNSETGYALAVSGSNIFEGVSYSGVLVSFNSGLNWSQTGFNQVNAGPLVSKGNEIFVGGSAGVWKTTNGGDNWISLPASASSLVVNGNNIFAADYDQIYLSTDDGSSWNRVRYNISTIFALATSGNALLAAEDSYALLRTTDNGVNWGYANIPNIRVLGSNGNNVFARNNSADYLSTDNGASFSVVSFGGGFTTCYAGSGNNVFAGTNSTGVWYSTDNGATWVPSALNSHNITALAVSGLNIFAGTSDSGVYYSSNSGQSWTTINDGMGIKGIRSLLILNNYLYAGTSGFSVWKRDISQLLPVNQISSQIPQSYSLSQNYPNPFNPSTKIKFGVPKNGEVRLVIYDAIGRGITTLVNEQLNAGIYEAEWIASNFPSGVYFYKLTSGDFSETKKLVLIK